MTKRTTKLVVALLGCLMAAAPVTQAWAHHSHAMFDDAQEITIVGKVTAVRFANPHVYLMLEGAVEGGEMRMWAIEMSHIGNMITRGVNAETFKVGDDVSITVNPLRNGQGGGNYSRIESINGVTNTAEGNAWSAEPAAAPAT
jgi:hypothetical protein